MGGRFDGHTSPGVQVGSKGSHVNEVWRGSTSGFSDHRRGVRPVESLWGVTAPSRPRMLSSALETLRDLGGLSKGTSVL